MRKLLLAALLFALAQRGLTQDKSLPQLQQRLSTYPAKDTAYINRILEFLTEQKRRAYPAMTVKQRDSVAHYLYTISQKVDYAPGLIEAMLQFAGLSAQKSDQQPALEWTRQADSLAQKTGNRLYETRAKLQKSTILSNSDPEQATKELINAVAIAETLPDKRILAVLQRNIGDNYAVALGNYAEAMAWLIKSINTSEMINDSLGLVSEWQSLGTLYSSLGDYNNALLYMKKTENASDSISDNNSTLQNNIGECYRLTGRYPEAIAAYQKSLALAHTPFDTVVVQSNMADVSLRQNDLPKTFEYSFIALRRSEQTNSVQIVSWCDYILSRAYLKINKPDSALYHATRGYDIARQAGFIEQLRDNTQALSNIYAYKKDFEKAYNYHLQYIIYRDSMINAQVSNQAGILQFNYNMGKSQAQIEGLNAEKKNQRNILIAVVTVLLLIVVMAVLLLRNNRQKRKANQTLQKQKQEIDAKAAELAKQKNNLELLERIGHDITSSLSVEKIIGTVYHNVNTLMDANVFGIGIYNENLKRIEFPATYENGKQLPFYSNAINDPNRFAPVCFNAKKDIIIGDLNAEYKQYIQSIQTTIEGEQPLSLIFLPLVAKDQKLGVLTVQSFHKNAYSDYHVYMLRNIAVYTAIALDNASSYEELKTTQAQLVQSEKMASLGELTAGIAHEIQNPLNFVNNFSEVNNELVDEMNEELNKGDVEEAKSIALNIKKNLERIAHHGKRADAIVKGMLQHSRSNSGQKEPTDINSLADEYLRLSYHGLRAKDKLFNATLKTDFTESLERINIIPQDIGRVLLNLTNNAFYAVSEKSKLGISGFAPTVTIATQKSGNTVSVTVSDNGNGIPKNNLDKIFQPFFTTKPTGSGTGLGLSLAYDVIKAHGGDIKVETKEGEGTTFTIVLPVG